MASERKVLVVEPDGNQARLLAVAIERTRPGTPVEFATLEQACAGGSAPCVVIFGGTASHGLPASAVAGLRKALGNTPLIALVPADGAPPTGLDAVYVQPAEWRALCATMRELLGEWLGGRA